MKAILEEGCWSVVSGLLVYEAANHSCCALKAPKQVVVVVSGGVPGLHAHDP